MAVRSVVPGSRLAPGTGSVDMCPRMHCTLLEGTACPLQAYVHVCTTPFAILTLTKHGETNRVQTRF